MNNILSNYNTEYKRRLDEDDKILAAILGLAILGAPIHFRTIQTYLTRDDLAGHPRFSSAWVHLRNVGNDRAFITTMGVDVKTFEMLLVPFSNLWDMATINRPDVNPHGAPQPGRRLLDAAGGLGLILHWISSTMSAFSLQQIFSITPAVCSRNLQFARSCLLQVLKDLHISRISWPSSEHRCKYYSSLIERKYPLLTKCFAFVDGLNLPVNVAADDE